MTNEEIRAEEPDPGSTGSPQTVPDLDYPPKIANRTPPAPVAALSVADGASERVVTALGASRKDLSKPRKIEPLNRAVVSGAVCVPVVGPRPWNIEAIGNLNFRF